MCSKRATYHAFYSLDSVESPGFLDGTEPGAKCETHVMRFAIFSSLFILELESFDQLFILYLKLFFMIFKASHSSSEIFWLLMYE